MIPALKSGDVGGPRPAPRPTSASTDPTSERMRQCGLVAPSEGNEVKREGRQEVGAARSTCESGEPSPTGPSGGKGLPGIENRTRER